MSISVLAASGVFCMITQPPGCMIVESAMLCNVRVAYLTVSSTRAHEVLAGAVRLSMPGIRRRVFRFTCIADLCDGYLDSRSSCDTQENS
jgi:hypothetical protein